MLEARLEGDMWMQVWVTGAEMNKLEALNLIRWLLRRFGLDWSLRNAVKILNEYMERDK